MLALTKNGSLGTVWLAAHVERRLVRSRIRGTNIAIAVEEIIRSTVPYTLRVSAYLLLGVTRIYARQTDHLLSFSEDTLTKLKKTQLLTTKGSENGLEFPVSEPDDILDVENLLDCFSEDRELVEGLSTVALHVSLPEHITLQETHEQGSSSFTFELDERFPEGGALLEFDFEGPETLPQNNNLESEMNLCTEQEPSKAEAAASKLGLEIDIDFEQIEPLTPSREAPWLSAAARVSSSEDRSECFEPRTPSPDVVAPARLDLFSEPSPTARVSLKFSDSTLERSPERKDARNIEGPEHALAPVTPKLHCDRSRMRNKRKRCVVIDDETVLSSAFLQSQLECTEDLLRPTKSAPCTYREVFDAQRLTQTNVLLSKFSVADIHGDEHDAWDMDADASCMQTSFIKENEQVHPIEPQPQPQPEFEASCNGAEFDPNSCRPTNVDQLLPEFESYNVDHEVEECTEAGWSTRTRGFALYLKEAIQKTSSGHTKLGQVLQSATKKRAACTFFDLLVLSSKGCVRVEQAAPYDDIVISPLGKLSDCT